MQKLKNIIQKSLFLFKADIKKAYILPLLFLVAAGIFGFIGQGQAFDFPGLSTAAELTTKAVIIVIVVQLLVYVAGGIITISIWAIIGFAQYNNFINEPLIVNAWVMMRDLCNMFFILALLIIAFATILQIEGYSAKNYLGKLLLMAILINFSKMICGIIIDASQLVMLTFINAIQGAGGNFVEVLRIDKYLSSATEGSKGFGDTVSTAFQSLGGYIQGLIFLVISAIVLVVFLAIIAIRIIFLWIYIIFSPLAFLAFAFPGAQQYASEWWSDFIKQVTTGPILAFFLWLSLSSVGQINNSSFGGKLAESQCFGPGGILCPNQFIQFVIGIGLLIGGLAIAQKAGGLVGDLAGKGMDFAKTSGIKISAAPYHRAVEWGKKQGYDKGSKALGWYGGLGATKLANYLPGIDAAIEAKSHLTKTREYAEEEATRTIRYQSTTELMQQVNRLRESALSDSGAEIDRQRFQAAFDQLRKRGVRVPYGGERYKTEGGKNIYDENGNRLKDEETGKKLYSEEENNRTLAFIAQAKLDGVSVDPDTSEFSSENMESFAQWQKDIKLNSGQLNNEMLAEFTESLIKQAAGGDVEKEKKLRMAHDFYDPSSEEEREVEVEEIDLETGEKRMVKKKEKIAGTGKINPLKWNAEKINSSELVSLHDRNWRGEVLDNVYQDGSGLQTIVYAGQSGTARQRKRAVIWAKNKKDKNGDNIFEKAYKDGVPGLENIYFGDGEPLQGSGKRKVDFNDLKAVEYYRTRPSLLEENKKKRAASAAEAVSPSETGSTAPSAAPRPTTPPPAPGAREESREDQGEQAEPENPQEAQRQSAASTIKERVNNIQPGNLKNAWEKISEPERENYIRKFGKDKDGREFSDAEVADNMDNLDIIKKVFAQALLDTTIHGEQGNQKITVPGEALENLVPRGYGGPGWQGLTASITSPAQTSAAQSGQVSAPRNIPSAAAAATSDPELISAIESLTDVLSNMGELPVPDLSELAGLGQGIEKLAESLNEFKINIRELSRGLVKNNSALEALSSRMRRS